MAFKQRPQPYRVQWPLGPTQVENIDEMFEILFRQQKQTKDQLTVIGNTAVASAAAAASSLLFEPPATEEAWPAGTPFPQVVSVLKFIASMGNTAATAVPGLELDAVTPATGAVTVQNSPAVRFRGRAWDTAASETVDYLLYATPITAATPRGKFLLQSSINGAAAATVLTIDGANFILGTSPAGAGGVYRASTDGTAANPVFGMINSGGGGSIGFYTPAANDLNLVCNNANQILWGVGLWRNSAALCLGWSSASDPNSAVADTGIVRTAKAKIKFYNDPEGVTTAGVLFDFSTDALLKVRDRADAAYATVDCLDLKTENATFMHRTGVALTNNAAAAAGTLNNAPAAGNPTKWIAIDDNGTTRFIPAW